MKYLIAIIVLVFSITLSAQNESKHAKEFIRVYDLNGKKIGKGRLLYCSETSIHLTGSNGENIIPVGNIGRIRTKRSDGNNLFMCSVFGTAVMAAVMASVEGASADPEGMFYELNVAQGAIEGAAIGVAGGMVTGGIMIAMKNSRTFVINGDAEKWKTFSGMLSEPLIAEDKATEVDTGLPFSN